MSLIQERENYIEFDKKSQEPPSGHKIEEHLVDGKDPVAEKAQQEAVIDRIVQDREGGNQEDEMRQPVDRKKPLKAPPVPQCPGSFETASFCKRVGEAESAEEDENTDRLRPSLDNRGNDCLDSAGTVPKGGPLGALVNKAEKGTKRDRPGRLPAP